MVGLEVLQFGPGVLGLVYKRREYQRGHDIVPRTNNNTHTLSNFTLKKKCLKMSVMYVVYMSVDKPLRDFTFFLGVYLLVIGHL